MEQVKGIMYENDLTDNRKVRLDNRTMTREEYQLLYQRFRTRERYWSIPDDLRHAFMFDRQTHFQHINPELPAQYKYKPVSDGYSYHLDMEWADWGGSQYEARLERAASAYHNGWSAWDATRILNGCD